MQQQEFPMDSVTITNASTVLDTWNQERTLDQLQSFVSGRLSLHEDADEFYS